MLCDYIFSQNRTTRARSVHVAGRVGVLTVPKGTDLSRSVPGNVCCTSEFEDEVFSRHNPWTHSFPMHFCPKLFHHWIVELRKTMTPDGVSGLRKQNCGNEILITSSDRPRTEFWKIRGNWVYIEVRHLRLIRVGKWRDEGIGVHGIIFISNACILTALARPLMPRCHDTVTERAVHLAPAFTIIRKMHLGVPKVADRALIAWRSKIRHTWRMS